MVDDTCRKTATFFFLNFVYAQAEAKLVKNPHGKLLYSVHVVVNFLFQLIFIFPLFLGMVMYANEFKTKEKQKLTEIKN